MGNEQRVRVKPASHVARDWDIQPDASGTVICRYRALISFFSIPDRIDVHFAPDKMIWGKPADEFEEIDEKAIAADHA